MENKKIIKVVTLESLQLLKKGMKFGDEIKGYIGEILEIQKDPANEITGIKYKLLDTGDVFTFGPYTFLASVSDLHFNLSSEKTMENKELIGKKVKGFKFETDKEDLILDYKIMDFFTDKIGEIISYCEVNDAYEILFNETFRWWYPADQIENHIVESNEMVEEPKESEIKTPDYYDNSKGSLYKIAEQRKWNAYIFDVVKRLDRGGKKDPLKQEIEKSIAVLQLWLKEIK